MGGNLRKTFPNLKMMGDVSDIFYGMAKTKDPATTKDPPSKTFGLAGFPPKKGSLQQAQGLP